MSLLSRLGVTTPEIAKVDAGAPLVVASEYAVLLEAHPGFCHLTDSQLVNEVRGIPGMVTGNGAFILPILNSKGKVNRAMAIAVLMGTKEIL